ncbi:alpha/beta hydrolase [Halalkalibacter akibai]|uniref:Lysophospholipase n=1 Tax=Halalkalibacter akibai (strain ATCC 43226 / DSM 21942 / CIP 109018 / JCM 9157 / 1139) TaxID=1236973 RepID=W4QRE3_HALA3|nr:alpha/beta hydrolase [Halalkalibacter akibai]GAE34218.1 lysophospholipase [Halalkalibacter akibai JCM 9157]
MWKWEVADPRGVFVIVHGAGEHHGRYQWLAEKWNAHGFDVVMGDLPGQGKTRGKRGHIQSFNQYIDTISEWIDEANTKGLPVFLLGHSMGGLVVIRTLMERNVALVSGVILSSPCLGLSQPPAKTKELASKLIHRIVPTFSSNSGIRSELNTRNEEIRELYIKDELRVTKVSARWYQELSKAMRLALRYPEKFPNVPLLVLQAGDDYLVNKVDVRDWFNEVGSTEKFYKEWEGLYHEVFNEPEREDVFRYAVGFVNLLAP